MSNPVAQRIEKEARERADEERRKAEMEAAQAVQEATEATETAAEAILERARETARQKAHGILADARLAARLKELAVRRDLMEETLRRALDEVLNLPVEKFRDLALQEILEARFPGEQELVTSPQDADVWDGAFLESLNSRLDGQAKLVPAQDPKLPKRSWLLRQERKSITLGPQSALRTRREELEEEIASVLFGGEPA
ncbi:MAG: V-type ATP synthase subunit E family protein [Planctomycetota bacterium]